MYVHPRLYIAIVDMRMIWWMSSPTWEDQRKADAAVYTLGDFFTKTINLDISRHFSKATKIIIASDPDNLLPSIKYDKRCKAKQGNSPIPRMLLKLSNKVPSVSEFNTFLCSNENKKRLQDLLNNNLFHVASSISRELICSWRKFV